MAETYEDDNETYAEPGSPFIKAIPKSPPTLPPRRYTTPTSFEILYHNQYGSRQTLISAESLLSVATAGSITSLNQPVHDDQPYRDYFYTASRAGTLNRVPSEYQILAEIPVINSPQKRVAKGGFVSTKTLESTAGDNNGMFVKEDVYFPSAKWPHEVNKLVNIYTRFQEDTEKQDLKRHIATKTLKFLERQDQVFEIAKLLQIESTSVRNRTMQVLLQESLEIVSKNIESVTEALPVLSSTFKKEHHNILLITLNLMSYIFENSKGNDEKKRRAKQCKNSIKPLLTRSKKNVGPFMVLELFVGQLKQTKGHKTTGKKESLISAMNFFEQYCFLFGLLNKVFTVLPLDIKLLVKLQDATNFLVNNKQKLDPEYEAMLKLIVTACQLLLKNDAYLGLQPSETTEKLLDILSTILENIKVSQEIRKEMITMLEPLLLVENKAVVNKIHFLFATNHRSPLQMSKLVLKYISKELLHTGIRLFQDSFLNEQVPVWHSTEGEVKYMNKPIIAHYLVPSQRCLLQGIMSEYKTRANKQETERHLNHLDILIHLQQQSSHSSIVQLFAYQFRPMPLFYITEKVSSSLTLNGYLLNQRERSKWLPPLTLAKIALEIVNVIVYLHEKHVIHRNLTSHAFVLCDGGQRIVMYDFSIAKVTENETGVTTDTDSWLIPTLWSSPESILENKFSFKSDVWMIGHMIYELFTHGCQPYTEMYTFSVDKILSFVIFHHLLPKRWPCIPTEVYSLIIESLCFDKEERIDAYEILKRLKDIVENQKSSKKPIRPPSDVFEEDKQYPSLDPRQDKPVRGLPPLFEEMKKQNIHQIDAVTNAYENLQVAERTKMKTLKINISDLTSSDRPTVIIKDDHIQVTEQVSTACVDSLQFHLNTNTYEKCLQMSKIPTWEKTVHPNEFDYILKYEMNCNLSLSDLAKSRHFGDPSDESTSNQYLEVVLRIVEFVMDMNSQGWILGSMRCSDMYGTIRSETEKLNKSGIEKVVMARLGRMLWFDRTGLDDDYVIAADVGSDSMRWCPVEVLRYKQYSFASDVYSLAMTINEFYMTLNVNEKDPLAGEIECAPFPYVSIEELQQYLYRDGKPDRPLACPDWLYQELCKCWQREEKARPSCEYLYDKIKRYLETGPVLEETYGYSDIQNNDETYEIVTSDDDYISNKDADYDNVKDNEEIVYEEIVLFACVNSDTESSDEDTTKKLELKKQKRKTRKQKQQIIKQLSESDVVSDQTRK